MSKQMKRKSPAFFPPYFFSPQHLNKHLPMHVMWISLISVLALWRFSISRPTFNEKWPLNCSNIQANLRPFVIPKTPHLLPYTSKAPLHCQDTKNGHLIKMEFFWAIPEDVIKHAIVEDLEPKEEMGSKVILRSIVTRQRYFSIKPKILLRSIYRNDSYFQR
ncbi:hypothetical protein EGR_07807 [Echinococcus granulosus]|uniref:Uncharacterized protein n=1 Tax=Echinococcus granulosus TaxID=6210 RepID=W6U7Y8_ECHGR|nr:hypothetical protein EGR_07807 [Echinococcus granulosus]EUB57348.1 hypothetical protein EGR_07807 [Echinococcus granulosus]